MKVIDTKFKEIENRQRLTLEEEKRRQGKIFDDQYELSKTTLALCYRIRNGSRELMNDLEKSSNNISFMTESLANQDEYFNTLQTLILDNRVILPEVLFKELHDLKACISFFNKKFQMLKNKKGLDKVEVNDTIKQLKAKYVEIDNHYTIITGIVQTAIGLKA